MKKIIFLFIFSIFLLCGCSKEAETDVYKIMKDNDHIIVDVRTKEEYDELHVVDAINIPVDEIDKNIDLDKDKIIFVYCRSGNRSSQAYSILTNLGYTVYDLGALSSINLEKE